MLVVGVRRRSKIPEIGTQGLGYFLKSAVQSVDSASAFFNAVLFILVQILNQRTDLVYTLTLDG